MFEKQPWLRFVEGTDGGAHTAPAEDQAQEASTNTDEFTDEVDYKAKYEAMKNHSREWESRAKANLAAAKKLKELEDAEKTEVDKLNDRLAESEKDKAALQVELDRMTIAAKHGLSAEDAAMFLHGDAETMTKQAEALAERARVPRKAEAPNQGRGAGSGSKAAAEEWAKSLLGK